MKDDNGGKSLSDSLALLADRTGDPYAKVYERLFEINPDYRSLFFLDTNGDVRGQMLSEALQILMDTEDGVARANTMFLAAKFAHDGYGVMPEEFLSFFGVLRDVTKKELGSDWSGDFDDAWDRVLKKLHVL